MDSKWVVVQRNQKWVPGATITESVLEGTAHRRFTATVLGWRNFRVWEGDVEDLDVQDVIAKVQDIKARIEVGDESVFATLSGEPAQ